MGCVLLLVLCRPSDRNTLKTEQKQQKKQISSKTLAVAGAMIPTKRRPKRLVLDDTQQQQSTNSAAVPTPVRPITTCGANQKVGFAKGRASTQSINYYNRLTFLKSQQRRNDGSTHSASVA